ncbi:LuxR C-terminal-related transcriptional regulator [Runella sp.]|uniref:LuxR C-terminal-related transcriptional regulator n=1 Tax=Runella sp. TaxID=1960881 RepID=UPI00263315B9|nr:LuxR C-terminal-related transcriptional regulator [Runella sp.]
MTPHDKFFEYDGQRISYREGQILLAYARGITIEQTAKDLFLSESTIKRHRENLRRRFSLQGYHKLRCFATELQPELEKWIEKPT